MQNSTTSERVAGILLAAWNSADSLHIRKALDQARAFQPMSTCEAERIELIQEICSVFRRWMEHGENAADVDASLELLRHLADARPRVAFREVPQLARHACVLQ